MKLVIILLLVASQCRAGVVRSPRSLSMVIPVQTGFHVTAYAWWGYQSKTCSIQSTENLRNWKTEVSFPITNDPTKYTLIDYNWQPAKFYRSISTP